MRTSNSSPPPELDPKIREIDYLAYLKDEHFETLDDFESKFIPSCIEQLQKGRAYLSDKQCFVLRNIAKKYQVAQDVKEGWLVCGYADAVQRTGKPKAAAKSSKMAQANDDEGDEGYEDDIPF